MIAFSDREKSGFTLVEVLLAMLISSIIVTGISAIYRQCSGLYERGEKVKRSMYNSNEMVDAFRDEFSGVFMPVFEDSNLPVFSLQYDGLGGFELSFCSQESNFDSAYALPVRIVYQFADGEDGEKELIRCEEYLAAGKVISQQRCSRVFEYVKELEFYVWPDENAEQQNWANDYREVKKIPRAVRVEAVLDDGKEVRTVFPITVEVDGH